MTIPGIIDPPDCDKSGVPLDWERCRTCEGRGEAHGSWPDGRMATMPDRCPTCDGHGSLKAAALDHLKRIGKARTWTTPDYAPRCEDCGHPMSEGTWEDISPGRPENDKIDHEAMRKGYAAAAWKILSVDKQEPTKRIGDLTLYSPCDEGCRHGGPGRLDGIPIADMQRARIRAEASWRPVDVRTLGWPHDLRPEKLAVLCLRCYAERP